MHARLVPIRPVPGAWLVSGSMSADRKSGAGQIAQAALELATKRPELVFRNPEKVEQGWKQMQEDRAEFRPTSPTLRPSESSATLPTGSTSITSTGCCGDLFADPALAADKRYAAVLRGYLRSETIGLLPLLRRRKAWYYQREPRPGVSVIGTRLGELAARARR